MNERIIHSDACVREGAEWLAACDPTLAKAYAETGQLPLRLRDDGFAAVLHAIIGQQVSVASANAVWGRVVAAGMNVESNLCAADDAAIQSLGFSRQKVRYAKALAAAGLDYQALRQQPTHQVIKTLTALPGIGLWTAEIYAMFSLGRADAFAAGDLAIQIAAQDLYRLPARPTDKALRVMAEKWAPWRSVAARILWAHYARMKSRDGVIELQSGGPQVTCAPPREKDTA